MEGASWPLRSGGALRPQTSYVASPRPVVCGHAVTCGQPCGGGLGSPFSSNASISCLVLLLSFSSSDLLALFSLFFIAVTYEWGESGK